jgi:chaperone LolA
MTHIFILVAFLSAPEPVALTKLQAHYSKAGNFSAKFTQTYIDSLRGKKRQERGELWVSQDGRVRWMYEQPARKEFVYDGDAAYFYEPENSQVTVFEHFRQTQLSTAMQFLWGQGDIAKNFTAFPCKLLCDARINKEDSIVELTPKENIPSVSRVALVISAKGELEKTVMLDALSNRTEYAFDNFKFNIPVDKQKFIFKVPSGVAVLRADSSSDQKFK